MRTLIIPAVAVYLLLSFSATASAIVFFEPNRGLPNYERTSPFVMRDVQHHENLKSRLVTAAVASKDCEVDRVPVPDFGDTPLFSNVCKKSEFEELRNLVAKLVPGLQKNRLTLWKADLHASGQNGLLVGYVDISEDKHFKYPYLSLWYLDSKHGKYRATYGGSYLAGQVHTIRLFGPSHTEKQVFVRYQSCLECHPWIFLTILNFTPEANANVFQFTYARDHKEFGNSLEYVLPGEGHSVDAEVESRLPTQRKANTPHLFQHFRYLYEAKHEWWVFTCKALKCDYEMYEQKLPSKYQELWNSAEKL